MHEGPAVAVVDQRPVGGTCALRGCRPKKLLVAAGEAVDTVLFAYPTGASDIPFML